jgi:hypothetical protein
MMRSLYYTTGISNFSERRNSKVVGVVDNAENSEE